MIDINKIPLGWGYEQAKLIEDGKNDKVDFAGIQSALRHMDYLVKARLCERFKQMFLDMIELARITEKFQDRIELERGRLTHELSQRGVGGEDTARLVQDAWCRAMHEMQLEAGLDFVGAGEETPALPKGILEQDFFLAIDDFLPEDFREYFVSRKR